MLYLSHLYFICIMQQCGFIMDNAYLSNCCGAPPLYLETDLCSDCKEHAEFDYYD